MRSGFLFVRIEADEMNGIVWKGQVSIQSIESQTKAFCAISHIIVHSYVPSTVL